MTIESALDYWGMQGAVVPLGEGHINETFLVGDQYVVQRVNEEVFPSAEVLTRNVRRVEGAIANLAVVPMELPGKKNGWRDQNGAYWRAYPYVASRTFVSLPEKLSFAAGEAFGRLLSRLRTCTERLEPAISGFHDFDRYLRRYDAVRRTGIAQQEQAFIAEIRSEALNLEGIRQVIHGDCKVSNLLFHPTEPRVLKVVDLDTLMEGHPALDFGDLLRSIGTSCPSKTWTEVRGRTIQAAQGFLRGFEPHGKPARMPELFARAPAHMSLMLGIRFLTDHFEGNRYFKTVFEGQNLLRAREQLHLCRVFREGQQEIEETLLSS